MSEPTPSTTTSNAQSPKQSSDAITAAAWTAGVTAVFGLGAVVEAPTWPVACAVVVVITMVTAVCCVMLNKR